jgi:hypothetical protein
MRKNNNPTNFYDYCKLLVIREPELKEFIINYLESINQDDICKTSNICKIIIDKRLN